jgi:putative endonuclease
MSRERQDLGQLGEKLACEFLRKNGYQIIDQNFRTRGGEIDIVAEKEKMLVFVEVKTRTNRTFGLPEEAIDERKQHKLAMTAECYLAAHHLYDQDYRIDSVAVEISKTDAEPKIRHEEDVVGW